MSSDTSAVAPRRRLALSSAQIRATLPLLRLYAGSSGVLMAGSAAQLVTFSILARGLGVEQFAIYVSIMAITNFALQLCGLGGSETLVRRVAQEPAIYPDALGHNIILIAATGVVLVTALGLALPLFYHVSPDPAVSAGAILLLVVSNVVLVRWMVVVEQIFIAKLDFPRANLVNIGFALARMAAAGLACFVFGADSVARFAPWQFAAHVAAALACAFAIRRFGAPRWTILREELGQGCWFSTPFIFRALRQSADLTMLSFVAPAAVVASFSVARRIVDTCELVTNALHRIFYPRLVREVARGGMRGLLPLSLRLLGPALGLALVTAVGVYVAIPWAPLIFGKDFGLMVPYARIMCWSFLLMACQEVAAEALGAAARHGVRATIFNAGNVVAAALTALLTYRFATTGTFVALYAAETAIAAAFWIVLFGLVRREARAASKGASA